MDRSYLVLIQPQVHNGAVGTGAKQKADAVRQTEQEKHIGHGRPRDSKRLPVNVGGNGLVRRLVHTADGQPNEALLPFN